MASKRNRVGGKLQSRAGERGEFSFERGCTLSPKRGYEKRRTEGCPKEFPLSEAPSQDSSWKETVQTWWGEEEYTSPSSGKNLFSTARGGRDRPWGRGKPWGVGSSLGRSGQHTKEGEGQLNGRKGWFVACVKRGFLESSGRRGAKREGKLTEKKRSDFKLQGAYENET